MYLYDIEVFSHDWLAVFHDLDTGEKHIFHNSSYELTAFLERRQPVTIGGYHSKHYDQWILKAIVHGADAPTVKELNDFIISGNNGWEHPFLRHRYAKPLWTNFDLMDDIPVPLRLKEIEGNLGMDIEESTVSFTIDRPLTDKELEDVIWYCRHDVDATARLFAERVDYLQSKIAVGAMARFSEGESLRLTNAKLTAAYLGARGSPRSWEDETVYQFPDNLNIERYHQVVTFFSDIDPAYKRTLKMEIAGVPHTIAWGGLHGALPCYREESTPLRTILHIDVTSYYPSLMIQNGYMSRNAPDPEEFRLVYERRIAAKKAGDNHTADALKLILNTTYGAMKNQYNPLYDPRMANAVCISGQLYLIDLIEKLEEVPTLRLIQSNTDGLILSCDRDRRGEIDRAVKQWEHRTGFQMGTDEVEKICQKDVNNYVMRDGKGNMEVKGGYVSNYRGGDFKNKSLVIVDQAVVRFLLDDIPPEETILSCEKMSRFQIITKAGKTYDQVVWQNQGKDQGVQNVNRVYASIDPESGTLYKVKTA